MNSILKHALGLTAAIALFAPTVVESKPLSNLRFAQGSSCGVANSNTHWTKVVARKGQVMNIIIPIEYDEVVVTKLTNVTTGKTFVVKGNYSDDYQTIISEDFVLKSNGAYIVKTYIAETNQEVGNGIIGICIN